MHVVPDLNQVVEAHAVADYRVVKGAAVDYGVGADLHVISDAERTELRNLAPASALVGRLAEAVRTQHGARMHQAAPAHRHAFAYAGVRQQPRALADSRARPDRYVRTHENAARQGGGGGDPGAGGHFAVRIHACRRRHRGLGMNARPERQQGVQFVGDAGIDAVRLGRDQRRNGAFVPVPLAQDDRGGGCRAEILKVSAAQKKSHAVRIGPVQRRGAVHPDSGIPSAYGAIVTRRQFAKRQSPFVPGTTRHRADRP